MMSICNRCKYSWRVRKLQTSNRRCPICRSYDVDYAERGTPVLPSRHIPHETGSAFIQKRIVPKFGQWEKSISEGDDLAARYFIKEIYVLIKQAERLHASETEVKALELRWQNITNEQSNMIRRSTHNLSTTTQ